VRRIFALIRIEFRREFDSWISLFFFLALPLLFTAAVGAGLSGTMSDSADSDDVRTPLAVVCGDSGELADVLWAALGRAKLEPHCVDIASADEFTLSVPADFSARLMVGESVAVALQVLSGDSASPAVEQAVLAAMGDLDSAVRVARASRSRALEQGLVPDAAAADALAAAVRADLLAEPESAASVRTIWSGRAADASGGISITAPEQASAGQIVTWVQITLLGAAEVLVSERLRGTLRRLLVMPSQRGLILGGKLLARLAMGLLQMALLLAGGALLFGVPWGRSPLAAAGLSLAFALATVVLGGLLATFMRSRGQVSATVVGLSMGLAALGGAWYPLEVTPPLYQQLAQLLPSTWAMRGYTAVLTQPASTAWAGLAAVLPEISALLAFAAVFGALAAWRLRHYGA
jgi:ABC-2 type transport system permease protein